MSHHFDTKLAKEDPRLNLCDFYLFDGPSGKTVMAMTVNPGWHLLWTCFIQTGSMRFGST